VSEQTWPDAVVLNQERRSLVIAASGDETAYWFRLCPSLGPVVAERIAACLRGEHAADVARLRRALDDAHSAVMAAQNAADLARVERDEARAEAADLMLRVVKAEAMTDREEEACRRAVDALAALRTGRAALAQHTGADPADRGMSERMHASVVEVIDLIDDLLGPPRAAT
jgi:hypothetical protein